MEVGAVLQHLEMDRTGLAELAHATYLRLSEVHVFRGLVNEVQGVYDVQRLDVAIVIIGIVEEAQSLGGKCGMIRSSTAVHEGIVLMSEREHRNRQGRACTH